MRIALYAQPGLDQKAGISHFTLAMIKALEEITEHEYIIICSGKLETSLEVITFPRWWLSFFNPVRFLPWGKINLKKKHNIDQIIDPAHYATQGLFIAPKRAVIVHDLTATLFPEWHRKRTRLAQRILFRKSLDSADLVVCVSHHTSQDLLRLFPAQRVRTIYPGIRKLPNNQISSSADSDGYFICVGTIEPRKNHKRIIEAFELICDQGFAGTLKIVGNQGWSIPIESVIKSSKCKDQIMWLGHVSDERLADLYGHAIGCVYTSLYEGFGLPIIEAMSLGCPVITSNVGAMQEVAGQAAILVNPHDVASIAQGMTMLFDNDKRKAMINLGFERAAAFRWDTFVRQLEAAVNEL